MRVRANGLGFELEDSGGTGPAVLLLMGLGMQLTAWPANLLDALAGAGLRVVRMDNRDAGLSSKLDHLGVPNLLWESVRHRLGLPVRAPYRLQDMAADALGVLDALGIGQAHLVGVSMGGMIAQRLALAAPGRVLSLASIMSSSGAPYLPGPTPRALQALMSRPRGRGEDAIVEHYVRLFQVIGSPAYPVPEAQLRERVRASVRRSYHPPGTARQLAAVAADRQRAEELQRLRLPTLVLHGTDDPLVPLACGLDTARRIPGARWVAVPGMGHDLPPSVVDLWLDALLPHLAVGSR